MIADTLADVDEVIAFLEERNDQLATCEANAKRFNYYQQVTVVWLHCMRARLLTLYLHVCVLCCTGAGGTLELV